MGLSVIFVDNLQPARSCFSRLLYLSEIVCSHWLCTPGNVICLRSCSNSCEICPFESSAASISCSVRSICTFSTCVSCAACLGVFDDFDKRFLKGLRTFRKTGQSYVRHSCFEFLRFQFGSSFLFFEPAAAFHRSYGHRLGRLVNQCRDAVLLFSGTSQRRTAPFLRCVHGLEFLS